jgi:hypothetical protein
MFEAARRLGYAHLTVHDLRYPQGGKPAVAGGPSFSISHTAGRIACAASADCELGLDHEEFTDETAPAHLRHWTAVEATLKALGTGLRRAGDVEVDAGFKHARLGPARFHLATLDFGLGFVACLATSALAHRVDVQTVASVDADVIPYDGSCGSQS